MDNWTIWTRKNNKQQEFKVKKDMKKSLINGMISREWFENGPRMDREKSRITTIKPLLTMLALLMVCLFGVNENACATWPTYSGTITTPDNGVTYYVLVDNNEHTLAADFGGASHEYNLGGPSGSMTFYAMKSGGTGSTDLYLEAFQDNTDKGEVWHGNPAGKDYKAFVGYTKYGDIISVDDGTINRTANKLRFYTPGGGTLSKKFKEVKVKMFAGVMQPSITSGSWTFTTADYAATDSPKEFTVDWSNLSSLPISFEQNGSSDDRSQFSYEITDNTKTLAKGNYGTATVSVKYKHDKVGTHSVKLKVGDYSITFTGTTNKITPYIVTTPTVDTITYGQTISNSQLGTGLVKADLINAAGTVVPGTWTIDEKGQTVTTSGGSNTTVHLTFTPTDGNTYNTIHTTQSMFVRSVATISWESAYSAEEPIVPVGKWIENAAKTNAAGAVITYSSTNPNVEISADGHSFRFTAESEAEIVASHGVTATHGSASETKTFKSTYKAIQVIVWPDRFDRLTTEMTSKNLLAQVWIENPSTGVRTYSAVRTALLEYSVEDNTVVSIPNNSTTLTIHKKGNTTLTASVEGNDQYESASVTMEVKVREPSAGCDDPLLLDKKNNGTNDYLYRFFQMNTNEIIGDEYAINVAQGQVPDKLSFGHKGEYYKPVSIIGSWTYFKGPIKAQQKVNGNWIDVPNSSVTPTVADWKELGDLQLDEKATHIRFVRPQEGEGYHYVRNVEVTMKHFIRTETPTVDFGNTIKVNSSEYQDVVVKYSNVKDALQVVNPFTSDVTVSDEVIDVDSCGAFGSATLRISFSPTTATEIDDYIVVKDPVVGNSSALSIRVKADVQRADQTITWNPATSISTIDQILLNGTTNGQEYGQMNVITYTVTNNNGVISVANNEVTILKPGTVTITASQSGSINYAAAASVEKNFTISAEPLTLVAPTAQGITYGQALSESELSGGSAKDSKGNDVGGTFAWQSPDAELNAGDNQTPTVVFTPSTNAAWYANLTTTANINVAKADPVVTVENVSFAYGTKAEEVALDGTGDGEWSWTDSRKGQTLTVGEYEMDVHFAPTDDANYNAIDTKITLKVTKANPVATANAVEITYGATAASVDLEGTGLEGEWTWTDSRKDDVLAAGEYTMTVHFVPTDAANYNEKDATVTLTVNKAPSVATPSAAAITAGQKVSESALTNSGTEGTWVWDDAVKNTTPAAGTYNYTVHFTPENDNYTTLTTTVSLKVNAPKSEFTNAVGDGDWNNPDNWTTGVPTDENPNVIVSGALEINEDVTVGNLTIENTGSIAVITGGTLTVKGTSDYRAEYGDVHVLNDGAIHLSNSADLQVRDFTLDAKLGDGATSAASGQVSGDSTKLHVNSVAYFQLSFDPSGAIDYGWYDFTVPFPVNISGGIERVNSSADKVMVCGQDFLLMEDDEASFVNGGKGWRQISSGVLMPGKLYTITFDETVNQNTFRFAWNGQGELANGDSFTAQYLTGSDASRNGWNAIGNAMLRHGYVAGDYKIQAYNHTDNVYEIIYDPKTFAVGTAFFIQVEEAGNIDWKAAEATPGRPIYAPQRVARNIDEFRLSLRNEATDAINDVLFFSASEEATEAYVIGHDLLKKGTPTEAKKAQMWATKGGKKLCDVETHMMNNKASSDLNFFVPKDGLYEIAIERAPEDATLYLTYNGRAIWNLSMSAYEFDLEQGTTEGYGLRIVANEQTTTDIENGGLLNDENGVRKVMIDDVIYIVTPEGKMYDIVGKGIKF